MSVDNINKQHGHAVISALIYTERAKVWMGHVLHRFGSIVFSMAVAFACQRRSEKFQTSSKFIDL